MKRQSLVLSRTIGTGLHAVFTNNHGRKIYLALCIQKEYFQIVECYYVDRSNYSVPKKLKTKEGDISNLLTVILCELDKDFAGIEFSNINLSKEELLSCVTAKKYNILILLKEGDILQTIIRNKFRRSVFLEIILKGEVSLIRKCYYCDKRGGDKHTAPYGLKTIYFKTGIDNILSVVNNELEGGFTDVLITSESTVKLDCKPICGSI